MSLSISHCMFPLNLAEDRRGEHTPDATVDSIRLRNGLCALLHRHFMAYWGQPGLRLGAQAGQPLHAQSVATIHRREIVLIRNRKNVMSIIVGRVQSLAVSAPSFSGAFGGSRAPPLPAGQLAAEVSHNAGARNGEWRC